jgi:hypothetical protein
MRARIGRADRPHGGFARLSFFGASSAAASCLASDVEGRKRPRAICPFRPNFSGLTRPVRLAHNRCARRESVPVTAFKRSRRRRRGNPQTLRQKGPCAPDRLSASLARHCARHTETQQSPHSGERQQNGGKTGRVQTAHRRGARRRSVDRLSARRNLSGTEDRGAMHETSTGTAPAGRRAWPFSFSTVPRPPP